MGFDAKFIKEYVLPDWWDDLLANVPANRALAEASISRMLGFAIRDLRNPTKQLRLPSTNQIRLKRRKNVTPSEAAPAIKLTERVAAGVISAFPELPMFRGPKTAKDIRDSILKSRQIVDLDALLEFAWSHGIVVLRIGAYPKHTKKIQGMALFCDNTPIVVLTSGIDSPPWIAFHLAHELGHIMLGHVSKDTSPVTDGTFDKIGRDTEESSADEFACELLVNEKRPEIDAVYGLTAEKLANRADSLAKQHGISPGILALIYGRSADRMGAAQKAIKLLGLDMGARDSIVSAMNQRLEMPLPEITERFLALVTAN